MIQGIIFDYDGTLANTQETQYNWFLHWGKLKGNPRLKHKDAGELTDVATFFKIYNATLAEHGSSKGAQRFYDDLDLPCNMSDLNHEVWGAYRQFNKDNPSQLYAGVKDALLTIQDLSFMARLTRWLPKPPIKIGLNSTKDWKTISGELKLHGLGDYFGKRHITKEDLAKYQGNGDASAIAKPSAISLDLCLRLMKLNEPAKIVHIGDTISDFKASHSLARPETGFLPEKMIFIGCSWGYEGRATLEEGFVGKDGNRVHCERIIDSPRELPVVIADYLR